MTADREKKREPWSRMAKAWFDRPDDPPLTLLKVQLDPAGSLDADEGQMA